MWRCGVAIECLQRVEVRADQSEAVMKSEDVEMMAKDDASDGAVTNVG